MFQHTCVNSLVDLEVFRPGKDLATSREGAGEWLLPGVHSDMIDQLVLGLEGPELPGAVLPEAGVVGDLWASHVLDGDVSDDLVQGSEDLVARLPGGGLLGVDPKAGHLFVL